MQVRRMSDREHAQRLLQDHFTASAALIAVMLKTLPDEVRTRTFDAVRNEPAWRRTKQRWLARIIPAD
jgi:hypothetical protein